MSSAKKKTLTLYIVLAALVAVLLAVEPSGAADSSGDWRKTYDQVLMWINFGIFVFLIVKFLRVPLKKFISGKQTELERKISRLEEEKDEADRKIQDILRAVDESRSEFDALKQKIIEQGETKKAAIIQDARQKSQVLLGESQVRIEHQIQRSRKKLRDELVDAAADLALERLPALMTADDNRKLIQNYIAVAPRK